MPPILFTSLPFQIALMIHALKTGRPWYWVWILLIGSWIGVLAYVAVELLPGFTRSRSVRRAATSVMDKLAPERRLKVMRDQLELAPSLGNRLGLARECLRLGDFQSAEALLREGMSGLFATDADLMFALAEALFGQGRAHDARVTLDALLAAHPNFRSPEAHLLYARCLEAEGLTERALDEFAIVADSFPGEEARVRYARLLKQSAKDDPAKLDKARALLEESLRRLRLAPNYYRREQSQWAQAAERELSAPEK